MNAFMFNQDFLYALGVTLLHSLWQILVVYIFCRILLYSLRRESPVIKYRILLMSLMVIPVIMIITFLQYFSSGITLPGSVEVAEGISPMLYLDSTIPVTDKFHISNNHLPWIVYTYMIGLTLLSTKFFISIIYLGRYKKKGVIELPENQVKEFKKILQKFRMKNVILRESLLAKVPMVIGFLKPVILVPAGILAHLPFNQVEAILLHELSHIKRHDYAVNILQSLIEILLFYHPLVYMISKQLRLEREKCCDDLALRYCTDNVYYVKALAGMEEYKRNSILPAVAFAEKHNLLIRIKRILKPETMKTKSSDRLLAGIIILAGIVLLLISGAAGLSTINENIDPSSNYTLSFSSLNKNMNENETVQKDTTFNIIGNTLTTSFPDENGNLHSYKMTFKNGELNKLEVDNIEIPRSQFSEYSEIVAKSQSRIKQVKNDMEKAEKELAKIDTEEMRKIEKVRMIDSAKFQDINFDSIRQTLSESLAQINWDSIKMETQKVFSDSAMQRHMPDMEKMQASMDINWNEINEDIVNAMKDARLQMENINWDEIRESLEKSMTEIDISMKDMEKSIQQSMMEIEKIDADEIIESLEKSKIELKEELEKIKALEQEMEK